MKIVRALKEIIAAGENDGAGSGIKGTSLVDPAQAVSGQGKFTACRGIQDTTAFEGYGLTGSQGRDLQVVGYRGRIRNGDGCAVGGCPGGGPVGGRYPG